MKQERSYMVSKTDKGNVVFFIKALATEPQKEVIFLYDGGQHALLQRGEENVILDYIDTRLPELLKKLDMVYISELNLSFLTVREYTASISHVQKLPNEVIEKINNINK